MHVALHARVSTGRQEREQTIASQLTVLRKWVAEHGHEVHPDHISCDEGWSGARLERSSPSRTRSVTPEHARSCKTQIDPRPPFEEMTATSPIVILLRAQI